MTSTRQAYCVGGGIGPLAGAAFLIREGELPGDPARQIAPRSNRGAAQGAEAAGAGT